VRFFAVSTKRTDAALRQRVDLDTAVPDADVLGQDDQAASAHLGQPVGVGRSWWEVRVVCLDKRPGVSQGGSDDLVAEVLVEKEDEALGRAAAPARPLRDGLVSCPGAGIRRSVRPRPEEAHAE
jgi:hypothetical protein